MTFQQRNLVAPTKNSGDDLEYGSWKYGKSQNHSVPYQANMTRKKLVIQEKRQGDNKFDLAYKHLGSKCKPEEKRIDYVLVHPVVDLKTITDEEDKKSEERKNELREKFERAMKDEKLQKQTEVIGDKIYTKIHCPFRRLCEEAEAVSLELPLAGVRPNKSLSYDITLCFLNWRIFLSPTQR